MFASRVETVAAEDWSEYLAKGQSMEGIPLDVQLRNAASTRSINRRRFLWDVARTGVAASIFGGSVYG